MLGLSYRANSGVCSNHPGCGEAAGVKERRRLGYVPKVPTELQMEGWSCLEYHNTPRSYSNGRLNE